MGFILNLIPFYSLVKLYFQLWLVLPQTQGSLFLYNGYIFPFLKSHDLEIEHFINNVHDNFWALLSDLKQYLISLFKSKVLGIKQKPLEQQNLGQNSYLDYLRSYNFLYSGITESNGKDNNDDKLSNSFVEGLLNQFKDQKPGTHEDTNAVSFLRSFLSTIPRSSYALATKNNNSTSDQENTAFKSPLKFAQTSLEADEGEEIVDSPSNDDEASGLGIGSTMGWVKVSKEKSD